jgi:hypothetical protein
MNSFWLIQRNPRDDSRDQLMTKYLGGWRDTNKFNQTRNLYQKEAKQIFTRLWPGKDGKDPSDDDGDWEEHWKTNWAGSWPDNWHSFPLQN